LVAERITSRFFNVVHLLSKAVPIIGLQANIVQIGAVKGLLFTKIIDFYQEPEDETVSQQIFDEAHWVANAPGTLACAKFYRTRLEELYGEVPTKYFEDYISLSVGGKARAWINRRKNERALIQIRVPEEKFQEVTDRLNQEGVSFRPKGPH
jgi:hypothetical protein